MQLVDGKLGSHDASLHTSERQQRDVAAQWMRDGIRNGELVIYLDGDADESATTWSSPATEVLAQVGRLGVDVDGAVADGRIEVLPVATLATRGSALAHLQRALDTGGPGVRMTSPAAAALETLGPDAYAQHERDLSAFVRTHPVSVLCQYRSDAPELTLDDVAVLHDVVRDAHLVAEADPHGLVLCGSIDIQNHPLLGAMLRAAVARAAEHDATEVRIDLCDTDFLSVSAWRAVVDATAPFRSLGGRVVLHGVGPAVTTLLDAVDAHHIVDIEP